MFELYVLYQDGEEQVLPYQTEEEARQGGYNIITACGNQVRWWCVRKKY